MQGHEDLSQVGPVFYSSSPSQEIRIVSLITTSSVIRDVVLHTLLRRILLPALVHDWFDLAEQFSVYKESGSCIIFLYKMTERRRWR